MHEAVIGLGSNLGSRDALLDAARHVLGATPGLQVLESSRLYDTPPLGPAQPDFVNAAVRVAWVGGAHGLLDVLLHTEALLGRVRSLRWGPRTVDLDLLWWSGASVDSARLSVPHPGLRERPFALAPLLDVAPELVSSLGADLSAAGGPPPARPWPKAPHGGPGQFAHAADAVAAAGSALLPAREPPGGPLASLAWDPTPRGTDLSRALTGIFRASQWGFWTERAVVLATSEGGWSGRLVGRYGAAEPLDPRALPGFRLVARPSDALASCPFALESG